MLICRCLGRAPGEEEDPQGPRQEEDNLHPPIRKRHHDWRQEKGSQLLIHWVRMSMLISSDEPQPNIIS